MIINNVIPDFDTYVRPRNDIEKFIGSPVDVLIN